MVDKNSNQFMRAFGYVICSSYRSKTIIALKGKYLTPTQIANASQIRTNHISKVLRELKELDLVVCINEDARKGRLYRLTDLGIAILEKLESEQMG